MTARKVALYNTNLSAKVPVSSLDPTPVPLRRIRIPLLGALFVAALIAAGCASTPSSTTAPAAAPNGGVPTASFARALTYPDRLTPLGGDSMALRWVDPSVSFGQYRQLLIEPILVSLDADSSAVAPNDLKALTDYFHTALTKAIDPPYPVATVPGPGVLRVRITIVDLVSTKPAASVVILLTPYATLPDLVAGSATGRPVGAAPYLGKTGIAVEFLDGATGAVVAEYVDTAFGRKYYVDPKASVSNQLTSGVTNYLDAYSTWAYAQQAFDRWALDLRRFLDRHRAGAAS